MVHGKLPCYQTEADTMLYIYFQFQKDGIMMPIGIHLENIDVLVVLDAVAVNIMIS